MTRDFVGGVSPRASLIATLWQGREPFLNFTPSTPPDLQGWSGSRDPWLERAVLDLRPRIIVEIGALEGRFNTVHGRNHAAPWHSGRRSGGGCPPTDAAAPKIGRAAESAIAQA